jgi:lysozyme
MSGRYHSVGPTAGRWPLWRGSVCPRFPLPSFFYFIRGGPMDDADYARLLDQLIRIEGINLAPYRDAEGNLIVADAEDAEWAWSGRRISVLEVDLRRVDRELAELWPGFEKLDAVRQRVLIHIAFNMRTSGMLAMSRFVSAVGFRLWRTAADEIMLSQWAKREKWRATVLAETLRTGRDELMSAVRARRG